VNIIEIRYLRNGHYEERTRVISDVSIKPGENVKAYMKRILEDGNVTEALITKIGGRPKDKGYKA
jgi:DNA-binding phage protein